MARRDLFAVLDVLVGPVEHFGEDVQDGFAGAMVRLRAAYDALNTMSRMTAPPDPLVDAMQSGDRLGYHPEKATEELAHFHSVLPQAQSSVTGADNQLRQRIEEVVKWTVDEHKNMGGEPLNPDAQRQRWLDALARAEKLVSEAKNSGQ